MRLGRHPLAEGAAEPLAVAWGEDRRGVFMTFAVDDVTHRMRWVPPGTFEMGSPTTEAGRLDDEGPVHTVTLTQGCWMGETPVTQALWWAVMGTDPSSFKGPTLPVECVSWDDCQAFCAALRERVPGLDARLPTEAEWEFVCRAGTSGATWLGGNGPKELDRIAWYGDNSAHTTHAVRGKAPNPLGLHDMLGNVWEWCSDRYAPYMAGAAVDPTGAQTGSYRVMRGGSWSVTARLVRAACRRALVPGLRFVDLGFRLARGQGSGR